jgi:hypothetical protein
MHSLAIVVTCVAAAMCYGIAHDQITARVCIEYFTIGHPQLFVFPSDDPTLLGFGWGIVATWWGGLILGIPLAVAARVGSRPQRTVGSLIHPIAKLLCIMALSALAAGIAGWLLASRELVALRGPIVEKLPTDRYVPFLADLWAHSASYVVGFVGGTVVIVQVWLSRR